jgi:eukaryotic-like serine/threonine-protein kinase
MTNKLSLDAFLKITPQSGLITESQLKAEVEAARKEGTPLERPEDVADRLVQRGLLTDWQCRKLLQGKHKGFFLGKYQLQSLLGKGGMSSVYLAEHSVMRRKCAVKVLPAKRINDSSYLGRFHREAQAVASLDHPNIVRAYDVDKESERGTDIHFLVMEYVDGKNLQEIVRETGVYDYVDAADCIRQAALGLEHAHKANMVHRDVKPGNLLVDTTGTVKLLDLGLARFFGDDGEQSLTVAHDEKVLGTADYLAPEQALDSHKVDSRADIYGLGCTLYFMLPGHPPFTDGTLAQRLLSHQTKIPPSAKIDRPDIPDSLLEILNRMMKKDPDDRYQTAGEVSEVMSRWLRDHASAEWKSMHPGAAAESEIVQARRVAKKLEPARPVANRSNASIDIPQSERTSRSRKESPRQPVSPDNPFAHGFTERGGEADQAADPRSSATHTVDPPDTGTGDSSVDPGRQSSSRRLSPDNPFAQQFPELDAPDGSTDSDSDEHSITVANSGSDLDTKKDGRQGKVPDLSASFDAYVTNSSHEISVRDSLRLRRTQSSRIRRGESSTSESGLLAARRRKKLMLAGAGIAGVLLFAAVIFFRGGDEGASKGVTSVDTEAGGAANQITVGANATYKTISAALEKARQSWDPNSSRDVLTIMIQPGTYRERVQLDNTQYQPEKQFKGGIHLVAADRGAVILAPPGSEPAISLKGIRAMTIDGLTIDSRAATVIRIEEYSNGVKLKNLLLRGFDGVGIHAHGVVGFAGDRGEVLFDHLTLESASAQAVGVLLESTNRFDTSNLHVVGSRFRGKMQAGIRILGSADRLDIRECLFSGLSAGIEFGANVRNLMNMTVMNNSFFENETPIRFERMPPTSGNDLTLYRNLFLKTGREELAVAQGGDLNLLLNFIRPLGHNWSDKPLTGAPPQSGQWNLFANGGRRGGLNLSFESENPYDENFLKPRDPNFPARGPYEPQRALDQVGAVSP